MCNKATEHNISKIWLIPLIIVIAIVPLVVMVHGFYNGLDGLFWFGSDKESFDFVLYYKALLIKTCGAIIAVIVVGLYIKNRPSFIDDKKSYAPIICILLFSVLSILSSVLASHTWEASFGGIGRFEGCYVILSYVIFFYFIFGYARSIKLIRFILDALMIGVVILCLLGVIEVFSGIRILDYDFLQPLYFLIEPRDARIVSDSTLIVSSTLENSNYVGSYVPLILPYCMYILLRGDRIWRRVLAGITFELACIFLYASESDTGLVAIAAGICVFIFLIFPEINIKGKIAIGLVGVGAIITLTIVLFSSGIINNIALEKNDYSIKNIETDYNSIVITTLEDKKIRVSIDGEKAEKEGWSKRYTIPELITIKDDGTNSLLELSDGSDGTKFIKENGYPELHFFMECEHIAESSSVTGKSMDLDKLHLLVDGHDFIFGTFLGANLCYLNDGKERVLLKNVDRWGFEGRYGFASGRGYLWACTIPLLKDYLLLGAGQDNYVYVFPNDDYIGKVYGGYVDQYTTKPHNMFLGIWVQQGLIALLAFLFLFFLFIIRVIRLCYGKHKVPSSPGFNAKGVAVMTAVGTSAYMVSGFANDTVVGVAHLYWILLGVGYAAEAICRRKETPVDTQK